MSGENSNRDTALAVLGGFGAGFLAAKFLSKFLVSKPKYKLYYFNRKERAEMARFIFALADVPYEDIRLSREEFANLDKQGLFPYKQVPTLFVNDVAIGQSSAINRFLARKLGLYGVDDVEGALIEGFHELGRDVRASYLIAKRKRSQDQGAAIKVWFAESLPKYFRKYEGLISKNEAGWCVGKTLSFADLECYELINWFDDVESVNKAMKVAPSFRAIVERVPQNPRLAKWIKERPVTQG